MVGLPVVTTLIRLIGSTKWFREVLAPLPELRAQIVMGLFEVDVICSLTRWGTAGPIDLARVGVDTTNVTKCQPFGVGTESMPPTPGIRLRMRLFCIRPTAYWPRLLSNQPHLPPPVLKLKSLGASC